MKEKSRFVINQALVTALIVVGITALSAVVFDFSGNIQLKIGTEGIQLQINGIENK